MKKYDISIIILIFYIAVLAIYVLGLTILEFEDCRVKNGIFAKSLFGYVCIVK